MSEEKIKKVNLTFEDLLDDYTNVSVRAAPGADVVVGSFYDLRVFEDESIEEICSNYIINCLPVNLHMVAIKEWWRILKPGGKLFVFCPDGNLISKNYVDGLINIIEFNKLLFQNNNQNSIYAEYVPRCAFDLPRLVFLCTFYGFEFEQTAKRPNAYKYELGIECKKIETKYPY